MKYFSVLCFLFTALLQASPLDRKADGHPLRIACVGDSITQGSEAGKGFSYPSQLQDLLGRDWMVGNFGVSGRTLLKKGDHPYWKEQAFLDAQSFAPDAVIIMLGTNDTKKQNWQYIADYKADYTALVKTFRSLPSQPKIYVCRPCPVAEPGNFGINETNLQQEIQWLDQLALELDLSVIDMHAALATLPQLLPDRVHPNSEGALVMAKTAFTALTGQRADSFVRVNSLFSNHAVLQRDIAHPVWGTAPDGTALSISFADQTVTTTASGGRWQVILKPMAATAVPRTMTINSPSSKIIVQDLLVGDVWLAGGQSNMEMQLKQAPPQKEIIGSGEAIAAADLPLIRQFQVPRRTGAGKVEDVYGNWNVTTPESAGSFSAVAFFFARDLQPKIGIPLGIIHSSWGGTPAETWMSREAISALGDLPDKMEKDQNAPSALYQTMIEPLQSYPLHGVIWYQGESNVQRAAQYRTLFPALIENWRAQWKAPTLPFLYVQIAPFGGSLPELREAQFLTLQNTPRTAMVVTTDIGDTFDIHPRDKATVGTRLALAARALAYGEEIEYSGPLFKKMTVSNNEILLDFDHTGSGLMVKDAQLRGFLIAGDDKRYVPAKAEIVNGNQVRVFSDEIAKPVAVRYGWNNAPDCNLFNKEGLPASPFRSGVE